MSLAFAHELSKISSFCLAHFKASNIFSFTTTVWYIGTEPEADDVLPRTEVSFNDSRTAEIDRGILFLNGGAFASVSELITRSEGTGGAAEFVLEPGRLVYNTLQLCNFVHRCVEVQTAPSILIRE